MSTPARRAVATAVVAVAVVLSAGAIALSGFNGDTASVLEGVGTVAFALVGALLLVRRPDNSVGALLSAVGLAATLLGFASEYARHALLVAPGSLPGGAIAAYVMNWCPLLIVGLTVGLLPQVFPDGRALQRWARPGIWAAWVYIVVGTVANALDDQVVEGLRGYRNPYPARVLQPYLGPLFMLSAVALAVSVIFGLVTLILRWRRSAGDERQQLRWFIAGTAPVLVPVLLHETFTGFSEVAVALLLPLVPVVFGVAILRYRLYDLDIVLNRAAVYVSLSALIAGMYVALVTVVSGAAGVGRPLWAQAVATVIAAACFQPARTLIQRAVDRLFYGDRSRPYEALARLGVTLERVPEPGTLLAGVVESVAVALRLPYVAIDLREGAEWLPTAAYGEPVADIDEYPMVFSDEVIGRLRVGQRRGQRFGNADRRLLTDLARQAGAAAHAVQLTLALQRSRAALVTAREEERRRLRRDLHDGLGPTLSGVTLGLHAAQANLRRDPDHAARQLVELAGQVEEAVRDIRRLVYGLRPPALDELGLTRAIQRAAGRLEADGLTITIDAPDEGLGSLTAAVEAAAYRIVTEALTNVSRHAGAHTCHVRLRRGQSLELEVRDDGRGLRDNPGGVGLAAMRERAAELGGTCRIESLDPGTRVLADLPLLEAV